MDKQQILDLIKTKLASGELTQQDLKNLSSGTPVHSQAGVAVISRPISPEGAHVNISKMLYYIGGLIVLIGVGVFVSQFWDDFGSEIRVLISLGGAVIAYGTGLVLSKTDEKSEIASAFHLLGGVLFPFGAITLLYEMGIEAEWGTYALLFGALTFLYVMTMLIVTYPLVTFFAIANATAALFALTQFVFQDNIIFDFYYYFAIVMGASYLYLGTQFIGTRNEQICRLLLLIGSAWFLGGAFMLYDSLIGWALLYPFLIAGTMALSIYVKRMSVLLMSTVAIMSYVAYITGKYFADSVGWPLALIVIGFLFIATGYFSYYLHQKYFK
ncbi:MAG: hypothetical protein G01um10148_192 [Parcubacteria group bacterium Gr01-1014_8]|nr:MAG: hypothetical protein G01um10148_192 [Parcubacteria group bacterium Gr01-1014_8]